MRLTTSFFVPTALRRRSVLVVAGLVVFTGLVASICWALLPPTVPPPPAIPPEGVERPVADAIASARGQVEEQPRSAEAWGQLGKVLLAHQFNQQAAQCFAQAEKLDGTQPRWPYYQGLIAAMEDGRLALPHLRRAAELADRHDPGVLAPRLQLAEELVAQGQTEEAEAQYRAVAAKDPNNPRLLYHWGLLALGRDELKTALDCLSRLTNSPVARKKACAQLALIYRRLKDEDQAARFSQQAARLPADASWEDRYAEEYRKLQVDAQGRLQQVRALETEGKLQEVVALLTRINKDTDSDLAPVVLGINLYKLGQYQEAERALRQALALYPDKVPAHFYLAVSLFGQADAAPREDGRLSEDARAKYQEAAAHFRRAAELKPDHGLAHLNLGRALGVLGQRDEALRELRAAVACRPEDARTHFYLAEALAEAGQVEEGRHQLDLAARLAGKDNSLPDAVLQRVREKFNKPTGVGGP
jgi:tetratricopeptide (TPR) repeat protein